MPKLRGKLGDIGISPPIDGWKECCWCLIEVAYSTNNPPHFAVLFTGYLDEGEPGAYSFIISANGGSNKIDFHRATYVEFVKELYQYKIQHI